MTCTRWFSEGMIPYLAASSGDPKAKLRFELMVELKP